MPVTPSRLTAPSSSRYRAIAAITAAGFFITLFFLLTAVVWHRPEAVGLDKSAFRLSSSEAVTSVIFGGRPPLWPGIPPKAAIEMGSREVVAAASLILSARGFLSRDRLAGIVALVGPVTTGVLTQYVAKPLINLPDQMGPRAFPSGHAAGITAIAVVATLLVYRRFGPWVALAFTPLAMAAVLLVGLAIVRLEYHYATDVFGGIALAAAVVAAVTAVVSAFEPALLGRSRSR